MSGCGGFFVPFSAELLDDSQAFLSYFDALLVIIHFVQAKTFVRDGILVLINVNRLIVNFNGFFIRISFKFFIGFQF